MEEITKTSFRELTQEDVKNYSKRQKDAEVLYVMKVKGEDDNSNGLFLELEKSSATELIENSTNFFIQDIEGNESIFPILIKEELLLNLN